MSPPTTGVTSKMTRKARESPDYRGLYLSSLALIYLIAFWSYFTQFPGLNSSSGLEPASRLFPYAFPWLKDKVHDVDTFCELTAVVGMLLSGLVATIPRLRDLPLLFLPLAGMYCVLVRTGGTFYSFQWDMLLLETGILTAFSGSNPYPLRFLLFKLMFMSGVVKLQANCPTWTNLTALEYHLATQCLPGPLAWHVHQLPPFLLRLGVAVTLWVEISVPFMLIVPMDRWRYWAALLQIILQILIILTGNYNYFNLLTMALCLPCLQRDNEREKSRVRSLFEHVSCFAFLAWTFWQMFSFEFDSHDVWRTLNVKLWTTGSDSTRLSEWGVPVATGSTILCTIYFGFEKARQTKSSAARITSVVTMITSVFLIGLISVPLSGLAPKLRSNLVIKAFQPYHQRHLQPYGFANGYGLFRRMTGVGSSPGKNSVGWAGLPPSIVERPEVVLEYQQREEGEWKELEFRWKPRSSKLLPKQMAPHQPRLDWQMWFAALGGIQSNPWLINLVKKILGRCEPVLNLISPDNELQDITAIRGKLYHYDFTRIDSEWSRQIPNAKILKKPKGATFITQLLSIPSKVWTRKFTGNYMPPFKVGDDKLEQYLFSHGFLDVCVRMDDAEERCHGKNDTVWCFAAAFIRSTQLHLLIPAILGFLWTAKKRRRLRREFRSRRSKGRMQTSPSSVAVDESKKKQ